MSIQIFAFAQICPAPSHFLMYLGKNASKFISLTKKIYYQKCSYFLATLLLFCQEGIFHGVDAYYIEGRIEFYVSENYNSKKAFKIIVNFKLLNKYKIYFNYLLLEVNTNTTTKCNNEAENENNKQCGYLHMHEKI